MGIMGRIVNSFRVTMGFDTTADALDRKIENRNLQNEQTLKSGMTQVAMTEANLNYKTLHHENTLKTLESVLENVEQIKSLSEKDLNEINSGMYGTVAGITGNLNTLNDFMEIIKKNINTEQYVAYQSQLNKVKEELIKRYIDTILQNKLQDNGDVAKNITMSTLYQKIQLEILQVPEIHSALQFVEWLYEIEYMARELKCKLSIENFPFEIKQGDTQNKKAELQCQLDSLERQKELLKMSDEYRSKDEDRKALENRKGNNL